MITQLKLIFRFRSFPSSPLLSASLSLSLSLCISLSLSLSLSLVRGGEESGRAGLAYQRKRGKGLAYIYKENCTSPLFNILDLGYIHWINLASVHWATFEFSLGHFTDFCWAILRIFIGPFCEFWLNRLSNSYWALIGPFVGFWLRPFIKLLLVNQ